MGRHTKGHLPGCESSVLTNLPPGQRGEYSSLVSPLDNRFGTTHQTELNSVRPLRKKEESLPELAEDVDHLTRLAYPGAAPEMIEVLAKDQFIDAQDEDIRHCVRQNKPATLRGR